MYYPPLTQLPAALRNAKPPDTKWSKVPLVSVFKPKLTLEEAKFFADKAQTRKKAETSDGDESSSASPKKSRQRSPIIGTGSQHDRDSSSPSPACVDFVDLASSVDGEGEANPPAPQRQQDIEKEVDRQPAKKRTKVRLLHTCFFRTTEHGNILIHVEKMHSQITGPGRVSSGFSYYKHRGVAVAMAVWMDLTPVCCA